MTDCNVYISFIRLVLLFFKNRILEYWPKNGQKTAADFYASFASNLQQKATIRKVVLFEFENSVCLIHSVYRVTRGSTHNVRSDLRQIFE